MKQQSTETSTVRSAFIKNIAPVSILLIPLLLIFVKGSPDKHPELTGKYIVTDMKINGQQRLAKTCSDSLLTFVYFDLANECVFTFNSLQNRMIGHYNLDADQEQISMYWHYPMDAKEKPFKGLLKQKGNNQLELNGIIKNDSIQVSLTRWKSDK
ncbi:MAG: hypothetical protein QM734_06740 [Cyclobacteriaceae bacterium]